MATTYLAYGSMRGITQQLIEDALSSWLHPLGFELASAITPQGSMNWSVTTANETILARAELAISGSKTRHKILLRHQDQTWTFAYERTVSGLTDFKNSDLSEPPIFLRSWRDSASEFGRGCDERVRILVCMANATPTIRILWDTVENFTIGMADVAIASPAEFESAAFEGGRRVNPTPGSVLVMSPPDNNVIAVVPSFGLSDSRGVARRVLGTILRSRNEFLSADWLEVEQNCLLSAGAQEDSIEQLVQLESHHIDRIRVLEGQVASLTDALLDAAEDAETIFDLNKQIKSLQKIAYGGVPSTTTEDGDEDSLELIVPVSCVNALDSAKSWLGGLEITADRDECEALDEFPQAMKWVFRIWSSLIALNDYSRFCKQHPSSAYGFYSFCRNPPAGFVTASPTRVAMVESADTMNNALAVAARTLKVPRTVDDSGKVVMQSHIKIDNSNPAPRIHFYDATNSDGKIIVGYIGKHLPL